jgi:thiol-disulfide isomerase/thioredoxin
VLLFVDRSSEFSETGGNGKEALDSFRELALQYQVSNQIGEQKKNKPEKSSAQDHQASDSKFKHPRLKLSPTARKIKLKEKLSTIMIINDDKHVTLDKVASNLEGSSLQKILSHLLRQNEEGSLHSLAKELGFQLLSDDIDIKSPSQTVQSSQVSPAVLKEGLVSNIVALDRDQLLQSESLSAHMQEENSIITNGEPPSQYNEEKAAYIDTSKQLISIEPHKSVTALEEVATAEGLVEEKSSEDVVVEEIRSEDVATPPKISSQVDNLVEQQLDFQGFEGSFFFSDGNYRLLRALTGGSKIPSLVIIDPLSQQHYVLPQESNFSYSSLADFLNGFLNGSLPPYQRSEPALQSPREATPPPFVNVDFHEVDSIPRVTTHTFSELVLGFNQSGTKNVAHTWNKDVLVLFSNNWCGFCQRMELVVREVFRAVKGNMIALRGGSRNGEKVFSGGKSYKVLIKIGTNNFFFLHVFQKVNASFIASYGQFSFKPFCKLFGFFFFFFFPPKLFLLD